MRLFYRHFGTGKPLIILHGLFGLSDNWVALGKRFASTCHVYIPDLRNHGQSPHSDAFNFLSLVDDLTEFIREHGLEKPVILGHSLSGKTTMLFSLENPGVPERIIIADMSMRTYRYHTIHQKVLDAIRSIDLSLATSRKDVEGQLMIKINDSRVVQLMLKNLYWKNRTTLGWKLNVGAIQENLPYLFRGISARGSYQGPVLFIRGGNSDYVSDADVLQLKEFFPAGRVVTIPGASHWLHADEPEQFYHIVMDFLQA